MLSAICVLRVQTELKGCCTNAILSSAAPEMAEGVVAQHSIVTAQPQPQPQHYLKLGETR